MDYIITKDELTSLADAIRRFDGTSGTLSYPNGFESAFDAALPWDFEGQDYDIVGGEGKIAEDKETKKKKIVIDFCSEIEMGKYAGNYSNLTYVSFPFAESVGVYSDGGAKTFRQCSVLTSISAPRLKQIPQLFMEGTKIISQIDLPECLSIEYSAFKDIPNLQKVSLPKCTWIGGAAFTSCILSEFYAPEVISLGSVSSSATLLQGVAVIIGMGSNSSPILEELAFPKCEHTNRGPIIQSQIVKKLTLGVSLWEFNIRTSNCYIQELNLPNCLTIDSSYSGYNLINTFLQKINAPQLTSIPALFASHAQGLATIFAPKCSIINESAFINCYNLQSIDFTECLEIKSSAFTNCRMLSSVKIDSCNTIQEAAFQGCSSNLGMMIINVSNCKYVGSSAFYQCSNLKEIKLYSNLEDNTNLVNLNDQAFAACQELIDVGTINTTTIPSKCFLNCKKLETINIPKCTVIKSSAFQVCQTLSNIYLPQCSSIGNNAFIGCAALTSISLPSCSYLGGQAFCNCPSLSSISLPVLSNTTIYRYCFESTALQQIDPILSKIKIIDYGAFHACPNIQSVHANEVETISGLAFGNCTSLSDFNFPSCTIVGEYAFSGCTSLNNITLDASISQINTGAFAGCTALNNLIILNSTAVPALGDKNVFSGTALSGTGSGYIYVPSNLLSNYKKATNWAVYSSHIKAIGT